MKAINRTYDSWNQNKAKKNTKKAKPKILREKVEMVKRTNLDDTFEASDIMWDKKPKQVRNNRDRVVFCTMSCKNDRKKGIAWEKITFWGTCGSKSEATTTSTNKQTNKK